jgi:signal transduction histidine kinase
VRGDAAVAARDAFLAVAAHELKTPVTSLRAQAQLVCRRLDRDGEVPADRLRAALTMVDRQSVKLARLVERLLEVAPLQEGRLVLDPAPVDLAALVREAVAAAQPTAPAHRFWLRAVGGGAV